MTLLRPLAGLLWDVGIPVIGFYALHLCGSSDWIALLAATSSAAARVGWVALRSRRITWFGAAMMAVFAAGTGLAFLTGDPRLMLAKNSVGVALIGTLFLASLATERPLTLIAFQTWRPRDADALGHSYRCDAGVRQLFRRAAAVWGVGMICDAVLRIPLIYVLPLTISVGASTALMVGTIGCLTAWTAVVAGRLPRAYDPSRDLTASDSVPVSSRRRRRAHLRSISPFHKRCSESASDRNARLAAQTEKRGR